MAPPEGEEEHNQVHYIIKVSDCLLDNAASNMMINKSGQVANLQKHRQLDMHLVGTFTDRENAKHTWEPSNSPDII